MRSDARVFGVGSPLSAVGEVAAREAAAALAGRDFAAATLASLSSIVKTP